MHVIEHQDVLHTRRGVQELLDVFMWDIHYELKIFLIVTHSH